MGYGNPNMRAMMEDYSVQSVSFCVRRLQNEVTSRSEWFEEKKDTYFSAHNPKLASLGYSNSVYILVLCGYPLVPVQTHR